VERVRGRRGEREERRGVEGREAEKETGGEKEGEGEGESKTKG